MPETTLRSFSFGGGVQSTAALVLAAQGRIDFQLFLFANVGDDSENPATLAYVEQHARPFAAEHGIELATLERVMVRSGEHRTLYNELTREGSSTAAVERAAVRHHVAQRAQAATANPGTDNGRTRT